MYSFKFQTYPLEESARTHAFIPHFCDFLGMYWRKARCPLNPTMLSSMERFSPGLKVLHHSIKKGANLVQLVIPWLPPCRLLPRVKKLQQELESTTGHHFPEIVILKRPAVAPVTPVSKKIIHSIIIIVTRYEKIDHLQFFAKIVFLVKIDAEFTVESNGVWLNLKKGRVMA